MENTSYASGLWMADLSITQTIQESVADTERGAVFGTQFAIQNAFMLIKNLLVRK
jgi:hypothetical protein